MGDVLEGELSHEAVEALIGVFSLLLLSILLGFWAFATEFANLFYGILLSLLVRQPIFTYVETGRIPGLSGAQLIAAAGLVYLYMLWTDWDLLGFSVSLLWGVATVTLIMSIADLLVKELKEI